MKTIHPAIAEHVMEENEKLREVLRCIADLPMDRCSTENDYRLSAAKAIALGALSQQPEPTDTFTAVDMATAAAQGFRDGQAAVEPATAQDEREAFKRETRYIVIKRRDLANLAEAGLLRPASLDGLMDICGQLPPREYVVVESDWPEFQPTWAAIEARVSGQVTYPAQTAPQPEQSDLRAIHAMILNALDRDAAEGKAVRGEMAAELRAALSAVTAERDRLQASEVSLAKDLGEALRQQCADMRTIDQLRAEVEALRGLVYRDAAMAAKEA